MQRQSPIGAARLLGSLKLRLAITGVVLIGLSVALTVFFVLRQAGQHSERSVLDTEVGHAERLAAILSSRIVSRQVALRAAASRLPLAAFDDRAAMREFLAGEAVLQTLFAGVSVIGVDGRMLALVDAQGPRSPAVDVSDRPYFRRTLAERRPVVSEPIVGRLSGETVIALTLPVLDTEERIVAVLTGAVRLDSPMLLGDMAGRSERDPALTVITDAAGRFIAHPERRALLRRADAEPQLADAFASWTARGRPPQRNGSAERLGEYVVAMAGVEGVDWMILRSTPTALLFAGLEAGRQRALWLGLAVALGGGSLLALATLLMLRPLRRLERRALRLLNEDLPGDAGWPDVGGEIGELSRVFRHVMAQREASREAIDRALARMQAVMDHAPVGIAFTRNRVFEVVSHHFSDLFGYGGHSLVGEPPRLIYASDEFYGALGERVGAAFAARRVFDEEVEFVRRDGSRFWGRMQGAPVREGDPAAGTIWTVADVTVERSQRERLSWSATHDALTGLVNRAEFEARLADQLRERRGEPAYALFIDLDRFKAVNDTAGHAAGDALLRDVAELLARRVRASDTVARLGGDEFAVLLRGCERDVAERVAEQMRATVHSYRLAWQGHSLQVGASIGLVHIDDSLADMAAVLAAADAACYAAKHAGRNRVQSHVPLRLVGS